MPRNDCCRKTSATTTTLLSPLPRRIRFLLAFAITAVPASAFAGTFSVLSYNVRGLPPVVIENRTAEIAAIAPLLEDFHTPAGPYAGIDSIVGLQEVFYPPYYDVLTNPATVSYPYVTVKDTGGAAGIGDGLTMLSDFQIEAFSRTQWDVCFGAFGEYGSDCDTNKGFTYARVRLEENAVVDVYTLHADAGQDFGSRVARRANINQLVDAINGLSPDGRAVIVLGDTNSLYTRQGNDNIQNLLSGTGLFDVWVQLRRGGVVPVEGSAINADCDTDPGSANCELVDKVFYRDGSLLVLAPQSYAALKAMFSDENGELSDHTPVAVTFDYAIVTTTTSTTSTSSTSTSTSSSTSMPFGDGPCGDPVAFVATLPGIRAAETGNGRAVVASDALFVLKVAVGSLECALCTCDVDSSGKIAATDALRVLKKAVGQDVTLTCPPCF